MLKAAIAGAARPMFPLLLAATLAATVATTLVAQPPPKVVKLEPANGFAEVDAKKTDELVVTFDRAMSTTGWSFCGGGPSYPPIPAGKRPRWKNKRTIVMPVELAPDHDYRLSLNCPAAKNFRSAEGVPLSWVRWSFSTLPEKLLSEREQRAVNKKALTELQRVLESSYSYYDLRELDWKKLFKEHSKPILDARTTRGWANAVGKMLEPTQDLHLYLQHGDDTVATGRRAVDPLYRAPLLNDQLERVEPIGDNALVGRTADGIGYLMIAAWNGALDVDGVEKALSALRDQKALVIDVRPNSGGDELLARRIAAWFVKGKKVYAKNRYRTGKGKNAFGAVLDREITGNDDAARRFDGPVAVLISPYVMSSCEAFVLMMKQAPDCTLVGQHTYGSSGNPKPHELSNDVTVLVPSWQAMLPDGTCFEGKGIEPDVAVEADAKILERTDPILARALEILRAKE